ncbi:putative homeobox transcription factor [Blumeria hordei DH14]|uniref:Putative homeobox transcription factor n=1 Tax=Blumeria graminis f. sp. hordei (strain DH14) TaxID=546991 RepID=N1J9E1_BLUG1|nr:putative homeobox transcription factor [Blumeria hordei DH14]
MHDAAMKSFPEGRGESKAKRKRTSPHDQAALEAQYRRNPKPNKITRAEIVEEISLNEKEVQIWFQNRRQIDRRKLRPLMLHEAGALNTRGSTLLSPEPTTMLSTSSSQSSHCGVADSSYRPQDNPENVDGGYQVEDVVSKLTPPIVDPFTVCNLTFEQIPKILAYEERSTSSCPNNSQTSLITTPGYPSSRSSSRVYTYSTPPSSQLTSISYPSPTSLIKDRRLAPMQDNVRNELGLDTLLSSLDRRNTSTTELSTRADLSSSLKCKKTADTSLSLLPPQSSHSNPVSESACLKKGPKRPRMGLNSLKVKANRSENREETPQSVRRRPVGRSRSARAWKFCCDREPHDELTLHAENESHGSAVAAISLIRSTGKCLLRSEVHNRNVHELQGKTRQSRKRTRLTREITAPAESKLRQSFCPTPNMHCSQEKIMDLIRSPSLESDKENWLPYHYSSNCRRPLPSSPSGKKRLSLTVLERSHGKPLNSKNLCSQNCERKLIRETATEDNDGLIPRAIKVAESLLPGEMDSGKYGDIGAIQGLLSLSQGNWR